MSVIDEQGRPEAPFMAPELDTLVGFLEFQRATLAWKVRGVDADGMRARVGVSAMTLGGILKHMALVEGIWFAERLHGEDREPPFGAVDWQADPDWEWRSAAEDTPDALVALWDAACERSRARLADALANGGLDRLAAKGWPDGTAPSVRWILCHMIEEYARHNGHADLLREAVDGETGE